MKKNNGAGKKKQQTDAIDEVEELLKFTQDDLLLKLNVNSHLKSKSRSDFIPESSNTNAIHPDLDLRFQALRSKKHSNPNPNPKSEINGGNDEDIDNLFARFAALKGPSNATITTTSNSSNYAIDDNDDDDDDDEEDEVSRIVNWAIDAARLDPSPSSDIDDVSDDDDDDDDVSSDDDDDDEEGEVKRKVNGKKKGSKK